MMIERNSLDRQFEKAKKAHKEQIASLESRVEEMEKLSTLSAELASTTQRLSPHPQASLSVTSAGADDSVLTEEKKALEDANQLLTERLKESDEQIFKLTAEIQLLKSQHTRQVQDLMLSAQKAITSEMHRKLQEKLEKETRRCRELEEALNVRSTESGKLLIGLYHLNTCCILSAFNQSHEMLDLHSFLHNMIA